MNNYRNWKAIYGIGGAGKAYRVLNHRIIKEHEDSIADIKYWAKKLRLENPDVKEVYIIDSTPRLRQDYHDAQKLNTVASHYQFYDYLQNEGIRIG